MSRDWKHVLASFSLKFKTEKDVQAPYGQLGKLSRKKPPDFSVIILSRTPQMVFKKVQPFDLRKTRLRRLT
jgi:hypothetical protein